MTFLKGRAGGADSAWAALSVTPRGVAGHLQVGRRQLRILPGGVLADGSVPHSVEESSVDPADLQGIQCGSDDLPAVRPDPLSQRTSSLRAASREGLRLTCDLAVDCDYEFYSERFVGNLDRATDYMLITLATLSVLYERDLNVAIRVTYLNIWTTPDDPYTRDNKGGRLSELRDFWLTQRAGIRRDLVHLVSGINYGGIAFIDALCDSSYGYGVSGLLGSADYPSTPNNFDLRILAHELGHNFGSPHTQNCFWQARGFAPAGALLDSCVDAEGFCYTGPTSIIPEGGGTIMSYCPFQRLDFHPACRSWMRTLAEASCMPADSVQPPRNVIAVFDVDTVRLSWEPGGSEGVLGYDIYSSRYPVDATPAFVGSTSTTSFVDSRSNVPTYYKIRAVRLGDQSGFSVEVLAGDRPPVVEAPATAEGVEKMPLTVEVTASDPDLEPIQSLTAFPLPSGAIFTAGSQMAQGTLSWTLACAQAGRYAITFAASNFSVGVATTQVTIQPGECPPIVMAQDSISGLEGDLVQVEVSVDNRGAPIQGLVASALPDGATFTASPDFTSGALTWVPGYHQAGTYSVTFTASNGLEGTAATRIEILDFDPPPVVRAPARASTIPGFLLQVDVSASDPDGDPIALLSATGTPPGASFSEEATHAAGRLEWLPSPGQEGSYEVTFTAANTRAGSAVTQIEVLESLDHPPLVSAPAEVGGTETSPLVVQVTASEPDGDPILSLAAEPLPRGAAFETDAAGTNGTLTWTPDFDQSGSYEVKLSAVSSARATSVSAVALTGTAAMRLTIGNTDRAPSVEAPGEVSAAEGSLLRVPVAAGDPDTDPIESLTADLASLPLGNDAQLAVEDGNRLGVFTWTPGFEAAGDYAVTFSARNALVGSAGTRIHVANTNRPPAAQPGGPYQGFAGIPLGLSGAGSADPDGDPLTYAWDFGDLAQGVGPLPTHTYSLAGDYVVTLTVSDGYLGDQGTTSARIAEAIEAGAYVTESNRTIRLRSAMPPWCALVEPLAGSFDPGSIDPASVRLRYGESRISAAAAKQAVVGDWDRDGLPEFWVCFSKSDLRTLFSGLEAGVHQVTLGIEGALLGGGRFHASLEVAVRSDGSTLQAWVAPNPSNPAATFTFATPRAGPVRVSLFDPQGRLLGVLLDEPALPAGYHDLPLRGVNAAGRTLASGIYFYRIETPDGRSSGRFAITR